MAGYRAIAAAYLLVAVVVAGSGLVAMSGCSEDGRKHKATEQGRAGDPGQAPSWVVFRGTSDASAAVVVDERTFAVADDENNILRAYSTEGGSPVLRLDLTGFLAVVAKSPEADIEGAARIGNRAYWISSHGRNRNGKWRPNRCRFFATEVSTGPEGFALGAVGRPYTELAAKLVADPNVRAACPGLAQSFHAGKLDGGGERRLAPKSRGLNIEGLCASADGNRLYIGLRNPLIRLPGANGDHAVIVSLLNPADVVDKAQRPRFGRPMLWNLGGLGIRDMVYSEQHRATFILAGSHDDGGRSVLYRWSGQADEQPVFLRQLDSRSSDWCPEALVAFPRSPRLLLLSDDGTVPVSVNGPSECLDADYYRNDGTSLNKHLRDESRRSSRARWIVP